MIGEKDTPFTSGKCNACVFLGIQLDFQYDSIEINSHSL